MKTFVSEGIATAILALGISLVTGPICSGAYCIPPQPGLISWWPGQGNALDVGGSNPGTLAGNTTFVSAEVGQGFFVQGSGDGVIVGSATNLQLQDFSIETWVRRSSPDAVSYGTNNIGYLFTYGRLGYGFGLRYDGRLFLSRVGIDNLTPELGISDTGLHHVAVTKSGTNVIFYLDGVAYPPLAYENTFTFSTPAAIGFRADTRDDSFLGTIDELAVYNRALSPTEVLAIYNAINAGKCRDPFPPQILTQPADQRIYVGDTATINVSATGDQPLAYQWQFNSTNLTGKTTASLVISNAQTGHSGLYSAIIANAGGSITSSYALLTVNLRPACVPVPDGLVSWWRFEGNTLDNWGENNGPTALSIPGPTGKVGQAHNFGLGIPIPDSASLRLTNSLALEAWVNPTSLTSSVPMTILAKFNHPLDRDLINQNSYFLGLTTNGAGLFILNKSGLPGANTSLTTSEIIPTNQWSFLVATYDGSMMKIYINGVLAAQTNYSGGIFAGFANLSIGGLAIEQSSLAFPFISSAWNFSGLIDEPSIYNRALNPDEVLGIYNADVSGKCLANPTIVTQPQNQAVPQGEDAVFSIGIKGSRPLKYQWRYYGLVQKNATNAAFAIERVKPIQEGIYNVAVTNALGFAISTNVYLTVLPPPACVPAPPGLISWWPGDGTGLDVAGANKATVVSPSLYTTGKVSLAFDLRTLPPLGGPSGHLVYVTNSPSLNFGSNADFSIEAWIKVGDTTIDSSSYMTIIDKHNNAPLNSAGYSLLLRNGRLACWLATLPTSATNSTMYISGGPDLRDGLFHHVAVTLHRSATNGGNLFVDGNSVLTFDPTPHRGSLTNQGSFLIGSSAVDSSFLRGSNSFFVGLIDEVSLYNRALSPEEIMGIRQAGTAGKCKAPPVIVTQPASQKVTIGSNATFTVTATGRAPLGYQWYHGSAAQSGATNATYSFLVQSNSGGVYSVRVSNVFATVTSSIVSLVLNLPPTAQPQQLSLNEDETALITLHGSDIQSDPLTYSIVTLPAHGSLSGSAPNLIYQPAPNYFGPDSFTFKVNDGLADSAPATVTLTILPVNDPPVALAQSLAVNEDTPLNILLTASDVDNDPLTFSVVLPPLHGSLSGTPPNLSYLAFTNFNGQDSFTFKANDGQTDSLPAIVTITINPVNDAPFAVASVSPLFSLSASETNLLVFSRNNSNAVAILDGSASWDVENDPLTFSWFEGTNALGTGANVTHVFAVGSHDVTLRVSDGKDTGTDALSFEVITAADSINLLIALLNSEMDPKLAHPLEATLNAAAASCTAGRFTPALNQLAAFQNKVAAQVGRIDRPLADELTKAAQEIIDLLGTPQEDLVGPTGSRPR